jgi:hypothetical protein
MGQSFSNKFKLRPPPQHDFPSHKRFFHSLVLGCVKEKFRATHVLAPFSPAPMSFDATLVFITSHFEFYGFFPFFLKD